MVAPVRPRSRRTWPACYMADQALASGQRGVVVRPREPASAAGEAAASESESPTTAPDPRAGEPEVPAAAERAGSSSAERVSCSDGATARPGACTKRGLKESVVREVKAVLNPYLAAGRISSKEDFKARALHARPGTQRWLFRPPCARAASCEARDEKGHPEGAEARVGRRRGAPDSQGGRRRIR